jgi:hypothetical protein
MTRDPLAVTAALAAARILGKDCMVTLFVEQGEIDAISRLVCDVLSVGVEQVKYSPPTETRANETYFWGSDGDDRTVFVTVHVLPATANDNRKEA